MTPTPEEKRVRLLPLEMTTYPCRRGQPPFLRVQLRHDRTSRASQGQVASSCSAGSIESPTPSLIMESGRGNRLASSARGSDHVCYRYMNPAPRPTNVRRSPSGICGDARGIPSLGLDVPTGSDALTLV